MKKFIPCVVSYLLLTTTAYADQPKPNIVLTKELPYSSNKVWNKIGQFCSIQSWQSLVKSCINYESDEGQQRIIIMKDNSVFLEKLEEYSSENKLFSYSIIHSPIRLKKYKSQLQVVSVSNTRSKIVWSTWYEIFHDQDNSKFKNDLVKLFKNGLAGIETLNY